MTVTPDPFNFTAGTTADAEQVDARFAPLYAALNGGLDVDNFLAAVKEKLGLSDAGVVRSGKSIIATEESRTNAAYGLLTTPDRVGSLVLPTDGLIFVAYQALWKCSASFAASAALFLGANQVKSRQTGAAPAGAAAQPGSATDRYEPLFTTPDRGLVAQHLASAATSDVATGQLVGGYVDVANEWGGGAAVIFAAAGTYDVSVQFLAAGGGTVTAKERKLWVWTRAF